MDNGTILLAALSVIGSLVTIVGGQFVLLRRDNTKKEERIASLEGRIVDLETQAKKVPDLEKQVDTLCKQLEVLQSRYEETEQNYNREHDANTQLQAKHDAVTIERDEARQRIEALTIENAAYRSILVEGAARIQASSGAVAPVTELTTGDAQAPAA